MRYIIGTDIGTSGTKTVLFDEYGRKVACKTVEYPLYQPHNGWAEQLPEDWKNAAIKSISEVISKSGVKPSDIVSVGLTGQMHGLVMLDEKFRVLRPSIIWCDQRTSSECELIENLMTRKRLIEITANPALTGFTASKIMWVKNNEPEIFEKCRHILLPKDYIRFVLTGSLATDVSDASGMQLMNISGRCWSDEVFQTLGIDKSLAPKLYESQEITGYITEKAAELTGLCKGTPVVAGAGDNAAAAIGVGVVKKGTAFTTIGTSGVVFAHTDSPLIDNCGRVHTFCHAVKGKWHVMGVTQAAGLSLRWLRDTVCAEEIRKASEKSVDPYTVMDKEAEKSPIGANRLLYMPYLMGERTPHLDPDARGAFIGLSAIHTRGDMIRAVLEGVCYSLKDCAEILKEMGICLDDMKLCGGGAKSLFWRKMLSDVYGINCSITECDEGPAFGAAILAMVGTGIYENVEKACSELVKIKSSSNCDKALNKEYDSFYGIYKNLYSHLKDDFALLAKK